MSSARLQDTRLLYKNQTLFLYLFRTKQLENEKNTFTEEQNFFLLAQLTYEMLINIYSLKNDAIYKVLWSLFNLYSNFYFTDGNKEKDISSCSHNQKGMRDPTANPHSENSKQEFWWLLQHQRQFPLSYPGAPGWQCH